VGERKAERGSGVGNGRSESLSVSWSGNCGFMIIVGDGLRWRMWILKGARGERFVIWIWSGIEFPKPLFSTGSGRFS
jgi:hypothetical protein